MSLADDNAKLAAYLERFIAGTHKTPFDAQAAGRLLQHLHASQALLNDLATGRLFAPCETCHGTGHVDNAFDGKCDDCYGVGTVGKRVQEPAPPIRTRRRLTSDQKTEPDS